MYNDYPDTAINNKHGQATRRRIMNKHPIRILSNMARAGGTLVSRCLGAMRDTVLLSEIHPLGMQMFNPLSQARDWYGLLNDDDLSSRQYSFTDAIELIQQRSLAAGKNLVIRDWAHLDFIGIPFVEQPAYRNQLVESLAGSYDIQQVSLVRHPADQWLSTKDLMVLEGRLDLETFLAGYRRYAELAATGKFMRYEDFTRDPAAQMKRLCDLLQLDYDADFITTWQNNKRVTGDTSGQSRGSQFHTIQPLQRRAVDRQLLETLSGNADFRLSLELLGYTEPKSVGQE